MATVTLNPGEAVTVNLKDSDGEFVITFGPDALTVETDFPDNVGREGVIYSEVFGVAPDAIIHEEAQEPTAWDEGDPKWRRDLKNIVPSIELKQASAALTVLMADLPEDLRNRLNAKINEVIALRIDHDREDRGQSVAKGEEDELRTSIVAVLRDSDEVRSIGPLADRLVEAVKPFAE